MATTPTPSSNFAAPFDSVASIYDAELDASPIMVRLRSVVWDIVQRYVPAGGAILELNCGTGTDAIELSKRGFAMTATDVAERMLAQGKAKSAVANLQIPITWRQLDVSAASPGMFGQASFDALYSNFGGLNCLNPTQLQQGLNYLSASLKPGGTVILSIMGKFCLWEFCSFLLRGNFSGAGRRTRNDALVAKLGQTEFNVWYFSPEQVANMISGWAEAVDLQGLSVFSPPPDSRGFINRFPALTKGLLGLDDFIRGAFPFTHLGDHFIIVARKRP